MSRSSSLRSCTEAHPRPVGRRFIEDAHGERIGLVELVEIDHLHRRGEFLIMVSPERQGRGYAKAATRLAINYAFRMLNLYKLYLLVDVDNARAIHIYEDAGFQREGVLIDEYFSDGRYHDAVRMCLFQHRVLAGLSQVSPASSFSLWASGLLPRARCPALPGGRTGSGTLQVDMPGGHLVPVVAAAAAGVDELRRTAAVGARTCSGVRSASRSAAAGCLMAMRRPFS
jgi:hypothetical protein